RTAWPLKPDVVFEGGNLLKDQLAAYNYPSVSLLTTSHAPAARMFDLTRATSAASALAARMAAQISSRYPVLWPETVRALMVHSVDRTECLKNDFLTAGSKDDYERLVITCGFRVPDFERALLIASDSLTLIVEDELQPFMKPIMCNPTA